MNARECAVIAVERETARKSCPDDTRSFDRFKVPVRLRVATGKCAETLVATSGMLAVLVIVLMMATLVRGIRLLHPR